MALHARYAYRVVTVDGTAPDGYTVDTVHVERRYHGWRRALKVGDFDGQRVRRVGTVHLRYIGKQTTE